MSPRLAIGVVPSAQATRATTLLALVCAALSWCALASGLLAVPQVLAISVAGLAAAFIARWSGRRQSEPFDGRLSLLAAIVCGVVSALALRPLSFIVLLLQAG